MDNDLTTKAAGKLGAGRRFRSRKTALLGAALVAAAAVIGVSAWSLTGGAAASAKPPTVTKPIVLAGYGPLLVGDQVLLGTSVQQVRDEIQALARHTRYVDPSDLNCAVSCWPGLSVPPHRDLLIALPAPGSCTEGLVGATWRVSGHTLAFDLKFRNYGNLGGCTAARQSFALWAVPLKSLPTGTLVVEVEGLQAEITL